MSGIAASPDPSTVSAKLACPFASDVAAASPRNISPSVLRLSLCHDNFGYAAVGADGRSCDPEWSQSTTRRPPQAQMVSKCTVDKAGDAQIFTYCRASVSGYQLV
jgi:hypothetical protein